MDELAVKPRRKHGARRMAITCRHIVRFIESANGKPVGFHQAPSDPASHFETIRWR